MSDQVSTELSFRGSRLGGVWRTLRRIMREPLGAIGLTLVAVVVLSAVFASVLTSYTPSKISPA